MGAWNGGLLKGCPCCGRVYDEAGWLSLRYVGELDDGVDLIEIRDCLCGSSIAVLLGPSPTADTQRSPLVGAA